MRFILENIRRVFSSPISSAFLLALSFEHPALSILSFFGLLPLILFIYSESKKSRVFNKSWLVGFLYFAIVLRWVLAAYPAEWAGIKNPAAALALVLFVWLGSSAVLGFTFAIFGLGARFLARKNTSDCLVIPALWAVSQYAGAWLFSFWSWGPAATLGPHWTLGNIGYALVPTPLAFWSRIGGLYLLGFVAAFFNVVFALLILKWRETIFYLKNNFSKSLLIVVGFMALIFSPFVYYDFFYSKPETQRPDFLKVILVQTNYGNFYHNALGELWDKKRELGELSRQPNLVVFPEGFKLFAYIGEIEEVLLKKIFPDQNRPGLIVTSTTGLSESGPDRETRKSFLVYRDQQGKLIDRQEKNFLIPTGEFMPELLRWMLNLVGEKAIVDVFNRQRGLISGTQAEHPVELGGYAIGVLACSGIISPTLYRNLAGKGASILVNSASHGIFGRSPAAFAQIKGWARMQAIANARPFLQASNGGLSYAIDADGRVIKETYTPGVELLAAEIHPNNTKTPYTKYGDWPILTGFLGILVYGFLGLRRRGDKNTLST